jgi:hypothetical protein
MMDDIKKEQLLDELMKYRVDYPEPQEGDIFTEDIRKRLGIRKNHAIEWMQKQADLHPDLYLLVKVKRNSDQGGGYRWALRRKEQE